MTSIVLRTVMPCFLRVRKLSALLMARSASRKLKTVRLVRRCTGPVVVGVLAKPLEDFGEDKVADRGWVVRSWSRRSVCGVDCPLK